MMVYLIGINQREGKTFGKVYHVAEYNKSVNELNLMLRSGTVKEFRLAADMPKTFERLIEKNGCEEI